MKEFALKLIKPDGTEEELNREVGLKELQDMVGGYIEHIAAEDRATYLYGNETGAIDGLPLNDKATALVRCGIWMVGGWHGNCVVMRND